jgi:hypothetical protein
MEEIINLMKLHENKIGTICKLVIFSDGDGRVEIQKGGFAEIHFIFKTIEELKQKLT